MQTLDVISVNIWQMIVSLLNLVLLYWLFKKFLYGPVKKMLESRKAAIDSRYDEADKAKKQALSDKEEYELKLKTASAKADEVVKNAADTALIREKEILDEAHRKAQVIVNRAKEDAALEMKKAEDTIKKEIVEVSSLLTEKLLDREISIEDHQKLIDSFTDKIGDENDAN